MYALDDLDRRLVSALRQDGRAPISKLSALLRVSRGTIESRLARLIDEGVILGFTVRVRDADASIKAVMAIEVAGRSTRAVINSLRGLPELRSLHTTNGSWDLIAEITVESLADLDCVLRKVRETEGVLNSETSLLLTSA